jgi:hypothetical protein
MDFKFLGMIKIVWVSRREITCSDLKELMKAWLGIKDTKYAGTRSPKMPSNGSERQPAPGGGQQCGGTTLRPKLCPLPAGGSNNASAARPI